MRLSYAVRAYYASLIVLVLTSIIRNKFDGIVFLFAIISATIFILILFLSAKYVNDSKEKHNDFN